MDEMTLNRDDAIMLLMEKLCHEENDVIEEMLQLHYDEIKVRVVDNEVENE